MKTTTNHTATAPPLIMTIPFAPPSDALNLGGAYAATMNATTAPWVMFMDYDAQILTPHFYRLALEAIADTRRPWGLLSCMATRTGNRAQRVGSMDDHHDIRRWRERQKMILRAHKGRPLITEIGPGAKMSGHVLIVRREAFEAIPPIPPGLVGIDWWLCEQMQRAGFALGIIERLAVYHYHRADGDRDHVARAEAKFKNPGR